MIDECAPDVYDLTVAEMNDARYRVFVFDGEVPTLVDSGFEHTVDTVVEALSELEIVPERLVITHGDGDHIGGLERLADHYGLETWVPEQTDLDSSYTPDHRYGDGDEVGDFVAVHTPGHAEDHHVLIDEQTGVAVLGDAVFGADARGLPAGYFVLPTGFYSADLNTADASLERLLDYSFDVGLVYHGSSVSAEASEKLEAFVNFVGKPQD
ncbi:MBL fold metallo-hydrolase [Haloferax namakaokahaiae]|uniref:MBL fold metallo-hydrolase n=1 Tax=Haloferax namakaokahaiae TaxID=1748331 RepID=A0ABD5ZDJ6_9EURY